MGGPANVARGPHGPAWIFAADDPLAALQSLATANRRALGAKRRHITMQFLVETVVLSVGGGLIGVVIGIIVPVLVSHLTTMRTIVTPWSVLLAFSISGAIGIIFGLYPAKAAAQLDPIEALRHE